MALPLLKLKAFKALDGNVYRNRNRPNKALKNFANNIISFLG